MPSEMKKTSVTIFLMSYVLETPNLVRSSGDVGPDRFDQIRHTSPQADFVRRGDYALETPKNT